MLLEAICEGKSHMSLRKGHSSKERELSSLVYIRAFKNNHLNCCCAAPSRSFTCLRLCEVEKILQKCLSLIQLRLADQEEVYAVQNVVPRDRIELSTPAFSGLEESQQDQIDTTKSQCKK